MKSLLGLLFYLLECARGHTIALLEILVEIGTVVVAYFVANLLDAHTRVLCEHSACLFEPESVSPCPEVGSEECQAEAKRLRKKRQQDLINGIEPIMDLQHQEIGRAHV